MMDNSCSDLDSDVLRGIDIFSGLSGADIEALAARMRKCVYLPGEVVFHEGESGEELFVLCSGLVAVSVRSQDGEDIELSRVGTGAFFGEMALLERAPRSATCRALESTECLVLGAGDFEALLAETPSAAAGILERMLAIAAGRLLTTGSFVSQMVQWGDDARRRAITDTATDLFNRRYLEDSFESILARAKRKRTGLSYAMFDLDRFGKLNAAYGSEFCDRVILRVADAFRSVFAEEDILVRYGGDEFCFLLPCAPAQAQRKCDAVCAALRELVFPEFPDLRISCSIGLAHLTPLLAGAEELKDRADKALYLAKEAGRDRAVAWIPAPALERKIDIATVAAKNRVGARIVRALEERESFLVIGHKDPDEDCVSSMVAFALLVTKFNKSAALVLGPAVQENFSYLINICRYNSIALLRTEAEVAAALGEMSTLVLLDTPKPSMIDRGGLYEAARRNPSILKIEIDHHLQADSSFFGDPEYRLVYEACSSCEIIGRLAIKLEKDSLIKARCLVDSFLTRNLVLAILSGMIGDSQMGKYLKSRRERWFYTYFSSRFERMLAEQTHTGSGNFSNKDQVYKALAALSEDEESCFRFMSKDTDSIGAVRFAVLDAEASRLLFSTYGKDIAVAVSRALVDSLSEASGRLGLVGYYDDPAVSSFVQFRLRRSEGFVALDLRDAIARLGITNGGGHPGAVGFRVERELLPDIRAAVRGYAEALEYMIREGEGRDGA